MAIRFYAPQAEAQYTWLTGILETFYLIDSQVEVHLKKVAKKSIMTACCLEPVVPITEPELITISWYASEVLSGGLRAQVKKRLVDHNTRQECPFLVNRTCSINAVRPLICREFFINTKPCQKGDLAINTRPYDAVPWPKEGDIQPIAKPIFECYKLKMQTKNSKAFESRFCVEHLWDMYLYDWAQIAKTMERFDNMSCYNISTDAEYQQVHLRSIESEPIDLLRRRG